MCYYRGKYVVIVLVWVKSARWSIIIFLLPIIVWLLHDRVPSGSSVFRSHNFRRVPARVISFTRNIFHVLEPGA